jgi:hypothetical protein
MHALKVKRGFDSESGNCRDTEQRRYVISTQDVIKETVYTLINTLWHADPLLGNDPYMRSRGTRHVRGDVTQQCKKLLL